MRKVSVGCGREGMKPKEGERAEVVMGASDGHDTIKGR